MWEGDQCAVYSAALRGPEITGGTCADVGRIAKDIVVASGFSKLILLMEIVNMLAESEEVHLIASEGYPSYARRSLFNFL